MENYKNLGGNSGVEAYEIGPDFISVRFSNGSTYWYTYEKPGAQRVEHMKPMVLVCIC